MLLEPKPQNQFTQRERDDEQRQDPLLQRFSIFMAFLFQKFQEVSLSLALYVSMIFAFVRLYVSFCTMLAVDWNFLQFFFSFSVPLFSAFDLIATILLLSFFQPHFAKFLSDFGCIHDYGIELHLMVLLSFEQKGIFWISEYCDLGIFKLTKSAI